MFLKLPFSGESQIISMQSACNIGSGPEYFMVKSKAHEEDRKWQGQLLGRAARRDLSEGRHLNTDLNGGSPVSV